MALARHDLDSDLVVHPQLLVRRDVAGALREVAGPLSDPATSDGRDSHDKITESWTHIEIATRPGGHPRGAA